jgi:hypothetical protein
METPRDLQLICDQYEALFPDETDRLLHLRQFLSHTTFDRLYDRANSEGHITASAMIWDRTSDRILIIAHRKLQK